MITIKHLDDETCEVCLSGEHMSRVTRVNCMTVDYAVGRVLPRRYPVPALYAKTVWFPEGSPFVACPGIPYVNLLAYNGASNGIRHGYYTLKRYYIFWDSVVDYLTY